MVSSQEMVSWHFGIPFSLLIHGTVLKKKKIRQIQVYMKGTAGLRMTFVFFSLTSTVYLEAQLFWI